MTGSIVEVGSLRVSTVTFSVVIGLGIGCAGPTDDSAPQLDASIAGPLDHRPAVQRCKIPPAPPVGAMTTERIAPHLELDRPLWMGTAPGEAEWLLVAEQRGRVLRVSREPDGPTSIFFERPVYRGNQEEGLLGLAFHPDYANNRKLYVFYSANRPRRAVISEYRVDESSPPVVDPTSERVILEVPQPYGNHNGGDIHFGPDGYLYISIGDGGSAADPLEHGQNKESLLGAILRVDVNSEDEACGTPYNIPVDNPFAQGRCQPGVESSGAPELWAWGLRNVWRMSFDRGTGSLWAGDVGQDAWEEVLRIQGGHNYGWNVMEGPDCFRGPCNPDDFTQPVYAYRHDVGRSITGGYVYRGANFPELWGQYIFGDYESGRIWAMPTDDSSNVTLLTETRARISSFGETADGELVIVTFDRGLLRLQRAPESAIVDPIPKTLTDTGCFENVSELIPRDGVYPYSVNVPFWSDGLEKVRWVALPDEGLITVNDSGELQFPVGTVALKTFEYLGTDNEPTRIETRIIRKDGAGWNGYTYRWRDTQDEADLLVSGDTVTLETNRGPQPWTIPSRAQCDHCHVERTGYALGLTLAQLNRDVDYPAGETNQLRAFEAAGLIRWSTPADETAQLPRLDDRSISVAQRARAVLDTNCAMCHQPDGPADAEIDLRFSTPLAQTNLCDESPKRGELEVMNARLVAPGDANRSVLLRRMQVRGKGQMPPLSSHVVDVAGTNIIADWIDSLTDCASAED